MGEASKIAFDTHNDQPWVAGRNFLPGSFADTNSCRVLVVDDDPMVRNHLAEILRGSQYLVEVAATGEEALRIFVQMVGTGSGNSLVVNPLYARRVLLTMAVLGHQDEVFDRLTHLRHPRPDLIYSPEWDCIRGDPRFQAWLKSIAPSESK